MNASIVAWSEWSIILFYFFIEKFISDSSE